MYLSLRVFAQDSSETGQERLRQAILSDPWVRRVEDEGEATRTGTVEIRRATSLTDSIWRELRGYPDEDDEEGEERDARCEDEDDGEIEDGADDPAE
jgi:hypothetical protein